MEEFFYPPPEGSSSDPPSGRGGGGLISLYILVWKSCTFLLQWCSSKTPYLFMLSIRTKMLEFWSRNEVFFFRPPPRRGPEPLSGRFFDLKKKGSKIWRKRDPRKLSSGGGVRTPPPGGGPKTRFRGSDENTKFHENTNTTFFWKTACQTFFWHFHEIVENALWPLFWNMGYSIWHMSKKCPNTFSVYTWIYQKTVYDHFSQICVYRNCQYIKKVPKHVFVILMEIVIYTKTS